jgi:hypothetical protein
MNYNHKLTRPGTVGLWKEQFHVVGTLLHFKLVTACATAHTDQIT